MELEQGIKDLTDKIRRLDSDNILVVEKVCELLGEYAEHNLYFDYKYHIIHYSDFGGIWVLYFNEEEIMEQSHKFLNTVAEMLDDSVLTWDNPDVEEEHLADIYEIWYDEIEKLENV